MQELHKKLFNFGWTIVSKKHIKISLFCSIVSLTGCVNMRPELLDDKLSAFRAPSEASIERDSTLDASPKPPLVESAWWELLKDKDLNALQEHALSENFSLKAALTRLAQAKGLDSVSLLQAAPKVSVGMTGTVSKSKGSSQSIYASKPSDIDYKQNTVQRNANVSWEIPLFGQIPAILAQAQANEDQAHWTYQGAKLSLATEITSTYLETLGIVGKIAQLRQEIELLKELLKNQEFLVAKNVSAKSEAWKVSEQLLNAQDQLTSAWTQHARLKHKMTALVGEVDDTYVERFSVFKYDSGQTAPLGIGPVLEGLSALEAPLPKIESIEASNLRKRPDLGIAEAKVLAAGAQAGFAQASLYPQFTLQGSLTAINGDLDSQGFNKGNTKSLVTSVGLHIPLLEWFALKAQATAKKLELHATVYDYRNTVVGAWNEAKSAFSDYQAAQQHAANQLELFDLAQRDLKLQEMLVTKKMGSKENLISAQLAEARVRGELMRKNVEYRQAWIKVLKGAWR